jgi:hypothetical protein
MWYRFAEIKPTCTAQLPFTVPGLGTSNPGVQDIKVTGDPRIMRISLLRFSLLQFFKTFQIYLGNAFLGYNISILQFFMM